MLRAAIAGATIGSAYFYLSDNRSSIHKIVSAALVKHLDPEPAHELAVKFASLQFVQERGSYPLLQTSVFGLNFANPVGMAAGFDKNGEAIDGLFEMGFGFVEIGTVTPKPQEGNPKPRVFRLEEDLAVINRYGFNSDGMDKVIERLEKRSWKGKKSCGVLGISIGKNKDGNAEEDYENLAFKFSKYADYLVINISSPNTKGLRDLQTSSLKNLIEVSRRGIERSGHQKPLLVKLSSDLLEADEKEIADILVNSKIDGIILSNTSTDRSNLTSSFKTEVGGLSGKPIFEKSTAQISRFYKLTQGKVPIIGVGGIFSADDAYDKIRAGASLIQVYTGLIYEGLSLVSDIKKGLEERLQKDGFKSISEAVGSSHRK